ncbi:copper resistance protein NlpE [Niabella sp. CC-SYL272]|uniref:copper resistance protein NlpE n=1 Tax=Niabella agricola TaxID=2891571 RepID=UPI001F19975F|nr:copper resistance protein NlpE [Niabella agricola]MCF3111853.1 copper resistance protein NlpE [Niabella agricola]
MKCIYIILACCIAGCVADSGKSKPGRDSAAYTYTLSAPPDSGKAQHADATTVEGTYSGLLPCASCEGIETAITLYADRSFLMKEIYKGEQPDSFINKGKYEIKDQVLYLKIDGAGVERPVMYTVTPNALTQLDMNGKEIQGSFAGHYRLIKN